MKLGELLEEVKVGEEEYKEEKTTETLLQNFDEDIENYRLSSVLHAMVNKLSEDLNEDVGNTVRTLRKIQDKIRMYEDKSEDKGVSKAYARMKLDSITEDYNTLVESIGKKKVQRQLNKDALAHSLGLVQFTQGRLMREAEVDSVNTRDLPEHFEPVVKKEYKIIEDAIGY